GDARGAVADAGHDGAREARGRAPHADRPRSRDAVCHRAGRAVGHRASGPARRPASGAGRNRARDAAHGRARPVVPARPTPGAPPGGPAAPPGPQGIEKSWATAVEAYQRGDVEPLIREFGTDAARDSSIGDYVRYLLADALARVDDLAGARASALSVADKFPTSDWCRARCSWSRRPTCPPPRAP